MKATAFFFLSIFTFYGSFSYCQTYIYEDISGDTQWSLDGSPFIILQGISIFEGATLTIDPGVVVQFEDDVWGLGISGGTLICNGTETDIILFTSVAGGIDPDGDYESALGVNNNPNSEISYVAIEHANVGAMVFDSVLLTNVEFRQNRSGLLAGGGVSEFVNCSFRNNLYGFEAFQGAFCDIVDCHFEGNGWGAQTFDSWTSLNIEGGTFQDNDVGAMGRIFVDYSTFLGNHLYGASIIGNGRISNSSFFGNAEADISISQFVYGTISINDSDLWGTHGFCVKISGWCFQPLLDATHNFWGTDDVAEINEKIYDANDDPQLYTIVDFVPFSAGTVVAVPVRESNQSGILHVRPNPFNPQTAIEYSLKEEGPVNLAVYDIRGRLIVQLINEIRLAGWGSASWDGRDVTGAPVASGVYLVRLQTASVIHTQKLVLAR